MIPGVSTPAAATPRRRTRAENRDYRRESLIGAALAVVAEHDITGATVNRICETAGVSRGLIGHYFDSKEHLLVVALESHLERSVAVTRAVAEQAYPDARETLQAMARASFEPPVFSVQEMAAWQAFTNASRSIEVFRAPIRAAAAALRELFEPQFALAARQRGLEVQAALAAFGLVTLLDGLWTSLATGKDDVTTEDAIAVCESYIEGCFRRKADEHAVAGVDGVRCAPIRRGA